KAFGVVPIGLERQRIAQLLASLFFEMVRQTPLRESDATVSTALCLGARPEPRISLAEVRSVQLDEALGYGHRSGRTLNLVLIAGPYDLTGNDNAAPQDENPLGGRAHAGCRDVVIGPDKSRV